MKPKSFLLYFDYRKHLNLITDSQDFRLLIESIFDYMEYDKLPTKLSSTAQMAFSFIKSNLDRDIEKYNRICERNKKNSKNAGRPKENNNPENPVDCLEIQNNPVGGNTNTNTKTNIKNKTEILNTNMSHPADKATPKSKYSDEVTRIFEHWKVIMGHEKAKLDDDRKKNIIKALKNGFSEADICMAITGCSKTPHNMGDNDRGQRYNGLSVILKNADQTQRFINNYENPPLEVLDAKPKYKPGSRDEKLAMLERMAK